MALRMQARALRTFFFVSLSLNLFWFAASLMGEARPFVTAIAALGMFGQGSFLAIQLLLASSAVQGHWSPGPSRRSGLALMLIALAQPTCMVAVGLIIALEKVPRAGFLALVVAAMTVLGLLIGLALRLWAGRASSRHFLAIMLVGAVWPLLPRACIALDWASAMPGVFGGQSDVWLHPLVTVFWHAPICIIAAAWFPSWRDFEGGVREQA